jgi:MoaA/NifB/PqqE/SkfB family radical SAM enzyme
MEKFDRIIRSLRLNKISSGNKNKSKIITGLQFEIVTLLIGLNVIWIALWRFRSPWKSLKFAARVINSRKNFKTAHPKIVKSGFKYYMNLQRPGWPSKAFNRGINHSLNHFSQSPAISLFSLVFAITHKCGFQCEHCVEWEQLNQRDTLSAPDLVEIISRFYGLGVSQVYLSGGEPLNRMDDILFILNAAPKEIDFWIYTNGYNLSARKAEQLKKHGLKGVIVSLDDYDPERHDRFRGVSGSYQRALESARNAVNNNLLLAFSCCATNDFVSRKNLLSYAKVCRDAGASFIQFLEPQAVGHYQNKEVGLSKKNKEILEYIFYLLNFEYSYKKYPIVSYPDMIKRQNGCPGRGLHFLYVDAEGYVQSCPFCKRKVFHTSTHNLAHEIRSLRESACSMIEFSPTSGVPVKMHQV